MSADYFSARDRHFNIAGEWVEDMQNLTLYSRAIIGSYAGSLLSSQPYQ